MVIIRTRDLRKMNLEEIDKKLNDLKLELAKSKAQVIIGGSPENPGKIRELRKTIARIKTIKKEIMKGGEK